jgi:hypothetical protein
MYEKIQKQSEVNLLDIVDVNMEEKKINKND